MIQLAPGVYFRVDKNFDRVQRDRSGEFLVWFACGGDIARVGPFEDIESAFESVRESENSNVWPEWVSP